MRDAIELLVHATILSGWDPTAESMIVTDASDYGCGAGLYQRADESEAWRPIAFYSKALSKGACARWATFAKELYAMYASCRRWRHWLLNSRRRIRVWCDNAAVCALRTATFGEGGAMGATLVRWAQSICELPVDISHLAGERNIVADFLSRHIAPGRGLDARTSSCSGSRPHVGDVGVADAATLEGEKVKLLDAPEMREDDGDYAGVLLPMLSADVNETLETLSPYDRASASATTRWDAAYRRCKDFKDAYVDALEGNASRGEGSGSTPTPGVILFNHILQRGRLTLVPTELRRTLVKEMHRRTLHLGRDRLLRALRMRFDWPGIRKDVEDVVSTCDHCQRVKTRPMDANVVNARMGQPTVKFADVQMDFMSVPEREGQDGVFYDKVLLIVDRATRFVEAILCKRDDTSARTWQRFECGYLCRYGIPSSVLTDRDPLFTANVFQSSARGSGIRWCFAAPRTPQSDGLSERFVQTAKQLLRVAQLDHPNVAWPFLLPSVVFAINTSYHTRMKDVPFRLAFGYLPDVLPSGLCPLRRGPDMDEDQMQSALDEARAHLEQEQERMYARARQSPVYEVGDLVQRLSGKARLGSKWRPRWVGPYLVAEVREGGAILICNAEGVTQWVNARHLTRYRTEVADDSRVQQNDEPIHDNEIFGEVGALSEEEQNEEDDNGSVPHDRLDALLTDSSDDAEEDDTEDSESGSDAGDGPPDELRTGDDDDDDDDER
jgi:transposase InsO family protein